MYDNSVDNGSKLCCKVLPKELGVCTFKLVFITTISVLSSIMVTPE